MNSLLKRQIRKFLPEELHNNENIASFLDAIDKSYTNSEDQFTMLQRATVISSDELFVANSKLKEESNSQKVVIDKLEGVIDKLQSFNLLNDRPEENISSLKLVHFIDSQTKEIIKVNQQKDKLLKSLEVQNQELKDYSHLVSHDFRSAFQSIEALSTWLQEDYKSILDASGNESLQLIRENVQKMDGLVKGIFEYTTIRKIENNSYNIDLEILLNTILKKRITTNTVEVIIPQKLPTIKGDKYRLEKLFYHILDNAIKYNKSKLAVIEIGYTKENDFWNFYVKDNGIGIEEKYFDKIFEAFQKLENNNKSIGLGLSIVKKIIDIYHGKIWIESSPNLGSTFYFSLKN